MIRPLVVGGALLMVAGDALGVSATAVGSVTAKRKDFYAEMKVGLVGLGLELGLRQASGLKYVYVAEAEGFPGVGSWVQHLVGVKVPFQTSWFYRPTIGLHQAEPWNREPHFELAASLVVGCEWDSGPYTFGFDLLGALIPFSNQRALLHIPKLKIAYDF